MVDWMPLLPGTALWALALYLPLSLPLERFEQALAESGLDEDRQHLALAVGAVTNLFLAWILGPGWGSSMGLIAVLAGLALALGNGNDAR